MRRPQTHGGHGFRLRQRRQHRLARSRGHDWITVSREARPEPPEGAAGLETTTRAGHGVRAWKLEAQDGEGRLYIVSEGRKPTEDSVLETKRGRFEAELRKLHEGLSQPHRTKRYEKVLERVGRIKGRHPKVSRHYKVTVEKGGGANAAAVAFERTAVAEAADDGAGAYVLRTSHADWDIETVLRTYWRLAEIEATFRSLKPELGLRPVWHGKADRIRAHLFIAVLAYHAVHTIRIRLKAKSIDLGWESIRNRLSNWSRITTTLRETNGCLVVNRQDVRPDVEAARIAAAAAGVKPELHRKRMRVDT